MKHSLKTYVSVTATSVTFPPSVSGDNPPGRHLVGLAMLIAEQRGRERWRFSRRAQILPVGQPEGQLLEWAVDRLPADAILVGWNVDHSLVPLLLDAAAAAPPAVAHQFLARFHRLLHSGTIDMSLAHGAAAAPPLTIVAEEMAIRSPALPHEEVLGAWASGVTGRLRHDLADEALAIWRVFIRSAGLAGIGAEAATDEWVRRRRRLRLVERADSAR